MPLSYLILRRSDQCNGAFHHQNQSAERAQPLYQTRYLQTFLDHCRLELLTDE
jgi:hypothetical protein